MKIECWARQQIFVFDCLQQIFVFDCLQCTRYVLIVHGLDDAADRICRLRKRAIRAAREEISWKDKNVNTANPQLLKPHSALRRTITTCIRRAWTKAMMTTSVFQRAQAKTRCASLHGKLWGEFNWDTKCCHSLARAKRAVIPIVRRALKAVRAHAP